jgi:hexokinase
MGHYTTYVVSAAYCTKLSGRVGLQKYPGFADRVHEGLYDIFGDKGRNIVTHHAEDGSGVGSAIIAGMFLICLSPFLQGAGLTISSGVVL